MEKLKTRYVTAIFILLICFVFIQFINYDSVQQTDSGNKVLAEIPASLEEWQGKDISLEENVYEILETSSIIHRNYLLHDKNVFLSVVYYPETKVDFHSPEECLGGIGIQISKTTKFVTIFGNKKIQLNQMVRQIGGSQELIYYFYKAGDYIGQSYIQLRLNLVKNKFFTSNRSGALIRLSTPIRSMDIEGASKVLLAFMEDFYPKLQKL